MSIKVSIIVPIFNTEKYLEECLESIVNQTLKEIEVLCINDGSTDNSERIIDRYVVRYPFVHKLNKSNSGYGASMNYGLSFAKGEYIGFVESDDFIEPDMFETLYNVATERYTDITKSGYWDYYDDENGQNNILAPIMEHMKPPKEVFTAVEYSEVISYYHPSIWSSLYRHDFLKQNSIHFEEPKGAGWADNPFFFKTMTLAKRITWVDKPFYHYRRTNLESSSYLKDCTIPIKRLSEMYDVVDQNHITDVNILACLYGRTLMYTRGLLDNPYFNSKELRPLIQKLYSRMDYSVFEKRGFNEKDKLFYRKWVSPFKGFAARHFGKVPDKIVEPAKRKILFYNWVQYDEKGSPGGGVTKYLYNLIDYYSKQRPDVSTYFISSGYKYDVSTTDTYIKKTRNRFDGKCSTFEIVNSPVPAPAYINCRNPSHLFSSPILKDIFREFITKNGPFESIYFANIEGISLDIIDLKDEFPEILFVTGLHNYIPMCPEVFYFKLPERKVCTGIQDGKKCCECILSKAEHLKDDLGWRVCCSNGKNHPHEWSKNMGFEDLEPMPDPSVYQKYLASFISAFKKMDYCLAVSERVKQLFVENGFYEGNIKVSYIGSAVAEKQLGHSVNTDYSSIKLVFLGYTGMYEKGFSFLINALKKLPIELAKKVELFVAAIGANKNELENQLPNLKKVDALNGYTHEQLAKILSNSNLGIIPVLWEDNLPQVALEMVAHGVPILSSNLGGASELCNLDEFKFIGGNEEDFIDKLKLFIENPTKLEKYWEGHRGLTTMTMHINDLEKYL